MQTFGTMFSGGGLADVGLRAAGLTSQWGIELDGQRAQVARNNGFDVRTGDVLLTDPASLPRVDWLHASPPCTNFSTANPSAAQRTGGRTTPLDVALAQRVTEFARELRPSVVSIENVTGWAKTQVFAQLCADLEQEGYTKSVMILDAADYGVAQRRRRLFGVFTTRAVAPPPTLPRRPWDEVCWDWAAGERFTPVAGSRLDLLRQHLGADFPPQLVDVSNCNARLYYEGKIVALHRPEGTPSAAITQRTAPQVLTPTAAYKLSVRNLARLAGLPDSWVCPSRTLTRQVCGLGVSPPVLEALARHLLT